MLTLSGQCGEGFIAGFPICLEDIAQFVISEGQSLGVCPANVLSTEAWSLSFISLESGRDGDKSEPTISENCIGELPEGEHVYPLGQFT